uniref:Transposase n=1 Tax=Ditylenchus dipsaci TaxID=166011 RepID=A0A915EUG9_9BILA
MWKSLRAYYMATKKKKPSGSQAEQVKKWAHSDEMSFLDNFIKERPEQSSSLANKNGPHTFEVMIDDNETELKQHAEKFHSYMRMNLSEFNNLLAVVTPWLTRRSIRTPINPEERLMLTLRFLATGEAFRSLSFQFRLGVSPVSKMAATCCAIFNALKTDYLQVPATED